MRFVESCDFPEFSAYLTRLGLYVGDGELDRLKTILKVDDPIQLYSERMARSLVTRFGMKAIRKSTARVLLEMREIGKSCEDSWEKGENLSNFTSYD